MTQDAVGQGANDESWDWRPLAAAGAAAGIWGLLTFRGGSETDRLTVGFGGLLLWALGLLLSRRHQLRITGLGRVLLFYLLVLGLAVVWSLIPAISLEVAVALAMPALLYFLVRESLGLGLDWSTIYRFALAAFLLSAAVTIVEFFMTRIRASGLMLDLNANAALLNAGLLLKLGEQYRTGGRFRGFDLLIYAVLILALATTRSLGALLTLSISLVVFGSLVGWKSRSWWRLFGTVVIGMFVAIVIVRVLGVPDDADALAKLEGLGHHPSFLSRLSMSMSSFRIFMDHAPTGVGPGIYKALYPQYRSLTERFSTGDLGHNDYLQFLAEGGPLLALVPVALLGLLLRRSWRLRGQGVAQAGSIAAAIGLLLHAGMNFIFYVPACGAMLGLCLARIDDVEDKIQPPAGIATPRGRRWLLGIWGLCAATTLVVLGSRSLFLMPDEDPNCHLRLCGYLKSRPQARLQVANFIAATQPSWLPARQYVIEQQLSRAENARTPREALQLDRLVTLDSLDLIRRFPILPVGYLSLADVLGRQPAAAQFVPADVPIDLDALYVRALKLDPTDVDTRVRAFERLKAEGKAEQAYDILVDPLTGTPRPYAVFAPDYAVLLTAASEAATAVGRCTEARRFATDARTLEPSAAIDPRLPLLPADVENTPGCGMDTHPPAS